MSRLPIRLRLTLAFTGAMAVVFSAGGFLLYQHLGASLDRTLAQGLQARVADVAALVKQADTGLRDSPAIAGAGGFAQVIDRHGRILDQTSALGPRPLLTPVQQASASRSALRLDGSGPGGEKARLLAVSVTAQDQRLIVVVGAPLAARDSALGGLRTELVAGGPAALLLASLIGFLVSSAGLRPVERMRLRAAAISVSSLSERLPVTPSGDEVSRLGETLNEMLARVQAAFERERSFVADASHELRTPLALLRSEIELALDQPRSKLELEAALRSAGEETDRMSQLADDLLLLARFDGGGVPIRLEQADLDDVLGRVRARFETRAHAAGRRIETHGGGRRAWVDPLRLQQALGNLIANALCHGSGTIRLFATEEAGTLELHVTDEGPGFEANFFARAFERFSRAEERRSGPGAGLGLAIVAAVAQAHSGTATATNRPEGGADVWLSLPPASGLSQPTADLRHRQRKLSIISR